MEVENFKEGKFNGEYTSFFKTGEVREKGSFVNDKREGDFFLFYKTGEVRAKARYAAGKLAGEYICYNRNGARLNGTDCDLPDDELADTASFDDMLKKFSVGEDKKAGDA